MSGNRHGRDPFDDEPTRFVGRDDEPTQFVGRDDDSTRFIPRDGSRDGAYDPDADFAGGRSAEETRAIDAGQARSEDRGQYWAPLSPDERGVDPRAAGAGAGAGRGYDPRHDEPYDDPRAGRDDRDDRDDRRSGFGRGATIVAVTAIIAIVILVALMFRFLSGDDEAATEPSTTPPPAPSAPPSSTEETTTDDSENETSGPVRDEIDRLRDEVNSLRETPPAIPGLGGGEVTEATVPDAVGKSPAEVELSLRRAGFGDITVLDANGNETNSLAALTGTVAAIDPPSGSTATTDQPITLTLE